MSKDRFTPSRYHTMTAAEKRAASIGSLRERAVSCPSCDMQLMPADLIGHLQTRCPGPLEPGPGACWLSWDDALAMLKVANLSHAALGRWVRRGEVRSRGERAARQCLRRDLVLRVAQKILENRYQPSSPRSRADRDARPGWVQLLLIDMGPAAGSRSPA